MARPHKLNGGRPRSDLTAIAPAVVDAIVCCAMAQERLVLLLKSPIVDPCTGDLRRRALERVQHQLAVEFGAA